MIRSHFRLNVAIALLVLTTTGAVAAEPDPHAVKLYNTYCVQCHGINRDGNGINSRDMAIKPRDHTDSKAMGDTPDDLLFKAIKEGGISVNKSVLMPRWDGVLSDEDIRELVAYLRIVSKTNSR